MNREPGLRERKKQRTRETIASVALDLFAERGYHATTLADIAEAADVSTRTIFSYYPSKEDILFSDFPELKEALAGALAERPAGKDALETVRDFILSVDHGEADERHRRWDRIIASDETLRSHKRARLAEIEALVAAAIADDLDAGEGDLRPQLVAASLIAAMEVLDGKPESAATPDDVAAVVDPVITFLRAGLEAVKTPSEKARRRRTPARPERSASP
jgi:AcrR family transcriptional regulator